MLCYVNPQIVTGLETFRLQLLAGRDDSTLATPGRVRIQVEVLRASRTHLLEAQGVVVSILR